jgi:hypothetical protein
MKRVTVYVVDYSDGNIVVCQERAIAEAKASFQRGRPAPISRLFVGAEWLDKFRRIEREYNEMTDALRELTEKQTA